LINPLLKLSCRFFSKVLIGFVLRLRWNGMTKTRRL
jgi:hypothetical protein